MIQTRQGFWLRLPSVCVAMLPLVLATFIGASDKEVERYLPLYRDRKPSITDLVLIYQGAVRRLPWTPEQLAPYVSARDPQSNQEQWLFDGFLFIEYWDGRGQEYMPGQGQKPARKEHWAWLLERNFEKGRGVPALEEVCRAVADRIGKPARPRKVLLTLPTPIQGQTDWGKLNDKALDFRKADDRVAPCEWHIKNALAKWRVLAPKHLELAGFYWVNEIASEEREVLRSVAKVVHDQGLSLFWIPYWGADGAANWRELGFDAAWQQPNHFFYAHVPDKRLEEACSFARRHGMGLEMEFDRGMIRDPKVFRPRFHAYLDAFERSQAAGDASIAYYECEGSLQALLWAGEPESRACHERLIRFVLGRQRKADEAAKTVKVELRQLDGTWAKVSFEFNGQKYPKQTFEGSVMIVQNGKCKFSSTLEGENVEYTLEIDPAKKPKALDLIMTSGSKKGMRHKAIYQLEGDTLMICWAVGDRERPTEFTTQLGSRLALDVWERQKQ